jgi:uncharacterized membrane protein (UPF0127 family)
MKNANPVWRILGGLALAVGLLSMVGCGQAEPDAPSVPKTVRDWFAIPVGEATVDMQVAVTQNEMAKGLMGRRDLTPTQGMLFVYRSPQPMSFWMKNTPTPLDIGFFTSDGVLREVYKLHPFDERPVRARRVDLQYALEMEQGRFAELGIKVGDQLDLTALGEALDARGFRPQTFAGFNHEADVRRP